MARYKTTAFNRQRRMNKTGLARQTTQVGKPMKKTTKKGAYAINKKKAISTRLNPIRETKKWKDSDLALIITSSTSADYGVYVDPRVSQKINASMANLSPMCCNFGFHGLDKNTFIGGSRYARFLNQKIQFQFPTGENIPIEPQEAYLVHGWVLVPLNVSTITSGAIQPELVNPEFLTKYITEQVKEFYNTSEDLLDWVPKGRSTIKVLGKKLIRPRSNTRSWSSANVGMGAGLDGYPSDGAVIPNSPVYNLSWTQRRKQQMFEGPSGGLAGPRPLYFESGNYLPFTIVYQPTFNDESYEASRLSVTSDSIIYYSDM